MLVSVRAKFRSITDAEAAFKEVKSSLDSNEANLVTSRNIKKYVSKLRDKTNMSGVLKAGLMGGLLGLIFGVVFTYFFNESGKDISPLMISIMFVALGTVTGILISTAIYYISREKNVSISETDLENSEAMIVVILKEKALGKLRQILMNNNVEKIYRT